MTISEKIEETKAGKIDKEKITPEQWEIINRFKSEAFENWCKQYTDEHAIKWAKAMYAKVDKPEPVVVVCDSPYQVIGLAAYWTLYWKDRVEPESYDEEWMVEESKKVDAKKWRDIYKKEYGDFDSLGLSVGQWWRAWSMWYLGAKAAYEATGDENLKFDTSNLELFHQFNESCSTFAAFEGVIFVSRNPIVCEIENNQLHCTTGPAIKYRDGWEAYLVEGKEVTKKEVMG